MRAPVAVVEVTADEWVALAVAVVAATGQVIALTRDQEAECQRFLQRVLVATGQASVDGAGPPRLTLIQTGATQ